MAMRYGKYNPRINGVSLSRCTVPSPYCRDVFYGVWGHGPDISGVRSSGGSAIISRWMAGDENSIIDLKSRKRGCHGHDEDDCEPLTYCLR